MATAVTTSADKMFQILNSDTDDSKKKGIVRTLRGILGAEGQVLARKTNGRRNHSTSDTISLNRGLRAKH